MSKISRDKLLDATIKGLNLAQEKYLLWSNDEQGVSTGAEYVLTTYVADEVFNEYQDYLFVEKSIKEIIEDSGVSVDVNDNSLLFARVDGRADIALYKKDNKPKAIIELKNRVNRIKLGIQEDIKRVESLVLNNVIEFGIIAFVTELEKNKEFQIEEFEKTIKKLMMQCKEQVPHLRYKYKYEIFEPEKTIYGTHWSWASCAILFSKKVDDK